MFLDNSKGIDMDHKFWKSSLCGIFGQEQLYFQFLFLASAPKNWQLHMKRDSKQEWCMF